MLKVIRHAPQPAAIVERRLDQAWRALERQLNPLAALGAARTLRTSLQAYEHALVDEARARGHTWQEIGDTLGVRRQSAHERFGHADRFTAT